MTAPEGRDPLREGMCVPGRPGFTRDTVHRAVDGDAAPAGAVPRGGAGRIAVAAALAAGTALAGAVGATGPRPPEASRGEPPRPPAVDPAAEVEREAEVLAAVVAGFRSEEPPVRRETAGVVERLARDPDPRRRLALSVALERMGGREAVLSLCLLVGDADPRVRIVARRALLAEAER